ncbi:capsular biosynthesis protein [Candidatus Pacearchaeota archaeon]|nr:capsular biosynthesis protein [Candidatus Pacearchaeota archaeon]
MKIALATPGGGHLTELQKIFSKDVLEGNEPIYFAEVSSRTRNLKEKKYLFKPLGDNPIDYFPCLIKCLRILRKEKIDMIATTGGEIALPAIVAGWMLGLKTIFIESVTRVEMPSLAGKLCYPFSKLFLVQNRETLSYFGKKAKYYGGIV